MLKSELTKQLIDVITSNYPEMTEKAVIESTQEIIAIIVETLIHGGRMEIRGFGSFDVKYFSARQARNPKTGETLQMSARYRVQFRPAKKLRLRLNASYR
jgi:integration host factor subunit beta